MNLPATRATIAPLDACDKGVPADGAGLDPRGVGARGWNILREDLPLPVAVLKQPALDHNRQWMTTFQRHTGVQLAPHGKTTMSPQLFERQLADGAWAITVATPHQLQVARQFGYPRVFLANQLVGRSAIEYVFDQLAAAPEFEFYCLVDSIAAVEQLARVAQRIRPTRPICVLVEMGYEGGRTGCRSLRDGLDVARAVVAHPEAVKLCGVEGFEGLIRRPSSDETSATVESFLGTITALARACEGEGLLASDPILLSAGGSAYFDLVVKVFAAAGLSRPTMTILRSGCYLTHDSLMYTLAFENMKARAPEWAVRGPRSLQGPGFIPALEVWAYVQSRPERELVIAGLGKRDVSYDDLPVPLTWFRPGGAVEQPSALPDGHRTLRLNDQHCHLSVPPDSPLAVGDLVGFGISHPCLTFDKWRVLHIVAADYTVVESVRTYF